MPNIDSHDRSPESQNTPPFQDPPEEEQSKPTREGLPPSYRMRAESHYVDLLSSRASPHRERMLPPRSIEAPGLPDIVAARPLVESVRRNGVLEPLLVQSRGGRYKLISGYRRLAAALEAGLPAVPCLLHDIDDDEAGRMAEAVDVMQDTPVIAPQPEQRSLGFVAAADLAKSLTTLESCAGLLTGPGSDLARAVVANLISAEVWRASSLVQASRVVRREMPVARTLVDVNRLVHQLMERFVPERRLRSLQMDAGDVPADLTLAADERLVTGALAGAVLASIALVEGVTGARISVDATVPRAKHVTLAVTQHSVTVPDTWFSRAYDETWIDRPGGSGVLVLMLSIRETAQLHGGDVALTSAEPGTTIALTLPTAGARSS